MKNKYFLVLMFIFGVTSISFGSGTSENDNKNAPVRSLSSYPEFNSEGYTIKHFEETPEAFPNPMKGFKGDRNPEGMNFLNSICFQNHEYASVYRHYIKYSDLESSANDTVQKIIDWSNRAWAGIEKRNIKVNPRILLTFPVAPDGAFSPGWHNAMEYNEFWPSDIPQEGFVSRWFSKELEERLRKFILKLGQAWDNDPRVAAVEIGLWGYWAEHNLSTDAPNSNYYDGIIPKSMAKTLGDAFNEAFKNKKGMVRYPYQFTDHQFGVVHDSFAKPDEQDYDRIINTIRRNNIWKDQIITGEIAYDFDMSSLYGSNPDNTLRNNKYSDYIISQIKRAYASSLGWISYYTYGDLSLKYNTTRIQKALGYRYVIRSAVYKEKASKGESINFGFEVSNIGSAPFYYNWPVEVSLLDQNRNVVYKKNLNVDIRTWLPGEKYTIIDNITIPNNLTDGVYFLTVAILDPAGNLPSLRFANTNYFYGGRTPIGIIGVNTEPQRDFGKFDLLYIDRSLQYTIRNANPANRTINREQGIPAVFDRLNTDIWNGSTMNIRTGSETINGVNFTVYTINGNHVKDSHAKAITAGNAATVNNLKRMRAFSFTILGDGNDYKVSLQTSDIWSNAGGWDIYHTIIPTIKGEAINVTIFVDTLVQSGWTGKFSPFIQSNVQSIQFEPYYNNGVGRFEYKIYDIRTYQ